MNEEGPGMNVTREKGVYSRETTVRGKKGREGGYSVGCGADLLSREAVGRCEHRGGTRLETLVDSITDLRVCARVRSKLFLHVWGQMCLRFRGGH